MPTAETRARRTRLALLAACAPVLAFLLLPSLIIVPMALTRGNLIQFPPDWISVHAFADYANDKLWRASTLLSFQVAAVAVLVACVAGVTAAIALHGRRFRGRGLIAGVIMAPIVAPLVVLALGEYLVFAPVGMVGSWIGIGLVHGLLATPYMFISVQTSLVAELNPALVRSARSMGAGALSVGRHVVWPAIWPGVLAGAVLGFAVSFDEVVVALFLQGAGSVTLPVRMYAAVQYELTPKLAAAASVFLGFGVLALLLQAATRRGPLPR